MYEYWRFYQSGQFMHLFSMREDLRITEQQKKNFQEEFQTEHIDKFLSILSTLYSVTEIYKFASNIVTNFKESDSLEIIIELHGVKNRMLMFWDNFSRYLSRPYICDYVSDVLKVERVISKNDILENMEDLALNATIEIFNKFNWDTVNKTIFIDDQKKLLERKL